MISDHTGGKHPSALRRISRCCGAILAIGLGMIAASGCRQKGPDAPVASRPVAYPDLLMTFPEAQNVRFEINVYGEHLFYTLEEAYPATRVLSTIKQVLGKRGWEPMPNDFLNPDLPSSHIRGWVNYIDSTERPKMEVYAWAADWENDRGDLVSYSLSYRCHSEDIAERKLLSVRAQYCSAPITARYMQELGIDKLP